MQQGQPLQGPGGVAGLGNPRSSEVGEPGVLRLVTEPLVTEAGWLLPLALLGIPLILAILGWQWPLSDKDLAVVLWAGWLLPSLAYFTFTSGLFHAYYLIMLGPPLAALVGAMAWALVALVTRRKTRAIKECIDSMDCAEKTPSAAQALADCMITAMIRNIEPKMVHLVAACSLV